MVLAIYANIWGETTEKFLEVGSESGFLLAAGRSEGVLNRVGEPEVILLLRDSARDFSCIEEDNILGDCTLRLLSIRLSSCTPHVLSTRLPGGATCNGDSFPET